MSGVDEDDKPTVLLDLNALRKQQLKQEEGLANISSELEFIVPTPSEEGFAPSWTPPGSTTAEEVEFRQDSPDQEQYEEEEVEIEGLELLHTPAAQLAAPSLSVPDPETFAEEFLIERNKTEPEAPQSVSVILFDFQSDFFKKSLSHFPKGYEYKVVKTLNELNTCLKSKEFQIVAFNYDTNPKAVNQLTAQIKAKKPFTKTIIMARAISPEKARIHAKTPSGAAGYYQYPLDQNKIEIEFQKLQNSVKKAA